jgi:DNA-binding NarL/FixJ family response regulator
MPLSVLIADDNSVVRSVLRSELEQHPMLQVCGVASDGSQALEQALALNPDLLLLDFAMPDRNGIQVAAAVSKKLPHTRIILFTLFDDSFGDSVAAAAGVYAVLDKSDGLAPLFAIIEELLPKPAPSRAPR